MVDILMNRKLKFFLCINCLCNKICFRSLCCPLSVHNYHKLKRIHANIVQNPTFLGYFQTFGGQCIYIYIIIILFYSIIYHYHYFLQICKVLFHKLFSRIFGFICFYIYNRISKQIWRIFVLICGKPITQCSYYSDIKIILNNKNKQETTHNVTTL